MKSIDCGSQVLLFAVPDEHDGAVRSAFLIDIGLKVANAMDHGVHGEMVHLGQCQLVLGEVELVVVRLV